MAYRVTAHGVTAALVLALAVATAAGAACGGAHGGDSFGGGGRDAAGGGADSAGLGEDSGGLVQTFSDGGGGDGALEALTIQPQNPTLTVTVPSATPATQQFQALVDGSMTSAGWSSDTPLLGSIDPVSGLFTASGNLGGTATITAAAGGSSATTTVTVKLNLSENPGMVPPATQTLLQAGGTADASFRWLYPYDKTVFPRGLTSPVLQFAGTAPDAVYVQASAKNFTYQGFYGSSSPGSVTFSAQTWATISESAGASDPVTVQITKISGGQVTGPLTETWTIAQGSLKGTVYYNSYDSALAAGVGAVLMMKPGTPASLLIGGGGNCVVCHAVSSDGSTLVAAGPGDDTSAYQVGASYSLAATDAGASATNLSSQPTSAYGFGGLYPDGSLVLTCASMSGLWDSNGPNIPGLGDVGNPSGDRPSVLMNPKTGAVVPAPGFDGVVTHALMPAFSPDGTQAVFNHYDVGQGKSLAVMAFSQPTSTFSGLVDVVTDPTNYLAWPAFLPDSKEIVYNTVNYGDYATWNYYGQEPNHAGDLQMVDIASKTITSLDSANGISGGQVYLPYGASEAHLNFEPTVLPVAVGGYYWVVFTSRREYGNLITDADPFETGPARRKKLWITAIDVNPTPGTDASHPAFYINDQELQAGNMRGFWALDPCKAVGRDCAWGDECCTGYCRQETSADAGTDAGADGGSGLVCVQMPPNNGCAQEYEKCMTSADCCGASQGFQCINGFCAQPAPQ